MLTQLQQQIKNLIDNKKDFMINSNFSKSMIDNVVYVNIDLSLSNEINTGIHQDIKDKIKEIIEEQSFVGTTSINPDKTIQNYFLWNGFAIKTPQVATEYDLKYLHNDRRYTIFKSTDSNIELSFMENSTVSIKRIFRALRDFALPDTNYYYKDVAIPRIELYHANFVDNNQIMKEVFYDCLPVNIEGHMLDNRNAQSIKLTDITFVYKKYDFEYQ